MKIKKPIQAIAPAAVLMVYAAICGIGPISYALAADKPLTEGNYSYVVKNGKATITSYFGGGSDFMMIPSVLGGYPVTTIGNGMQTAFSNNNARGVVLFPDSVTNISKRAVYDYNVTYFFSIPPSVTTIEDGATSSIAIATIAGTAGTDAQRYAKQVGIGFSDEVVNLAVNAGKGGSISNSGTYLLPQRLERSYDLTFSVKADPGYLIRDVTVDSMSLKEAIGKGEYTIDYTLNETNLKDIAIKVVFAVDPNATPAEKETSSAGAQTDANNYEFSDVGPSAGKYANAIGICGGQFYATTKGGRTILYELVKTYASKDGSLKFRSQEEVKKYAAKQGLSFGLDYDHIHVYNYNDPTDAPMFADKNKKGMAYYVAYLYKTYTGPVNGVTVKVGDFSSAKSDENRYLNISSLFARNRAEITLRDWNFESYSNYYGPSEGTNFYGAASSLLADSGSVINLIYPKIDGSANIAFSTYRGKINITGGSLLGTASGAHGPYVAYGGIIYLNADSILDLGIVPRPMEKNAYIIRDKKTQRITMTNKLSLNETAIVTTQPTGTALATDTGGGTIVANKVVAKTYGAGSAGVYSIGSNEGLVYVYNSSLTSYMDAGLVSASGGYIYANNSVLQGLMGIKLRAGQNSFKMSEVHVKNSQVTAFYDADETARIFDVSTPKEAAALTSDNIRQDAFAMNMFANSRTGWRLNETVLNYWFKDGYTLVPGAGGGNKLAVIYTEGSKTPICIESTRLINKNYETYKNAPGSKAQNLLISSEGNGTANVFFVNDNSKTRWDQTGKSKETTELIGDFFIAEASESGQMMGPPPMGAMPGGGPGTSAGPDAPGGAKPDAMPGGAGDVQGGMPKTGMQMPKGGPAMSQKGNYLNASFENSEWQGTVLGVSKHANLTFDKNSLWKVTKDTAIDTLTVSSKTVISADHPVTVSYFSLNVSDQETFKFGKNVTGKKEIQPNKKN